VDARPRWTDDRLDDLAGRLETFRADTRENFSEVRADIRDVRAELRWVVGLQVTTLLGVVALVVDALAR
jgi:hypothetical protein